MFPYEYLEGLRIGLRSEKPSNKIELSNGRVPPGMRHHDALKYYTRLVMESMPKKLRDKAYLDHIKACYPEVLEEENREAEFLEHIPRDVVNFEIVKEKNMQEDKKQEDSSRIKKILNAFEETTLEEWRMVIRENFPDFLFAAELILSIIVQILILDITNPFGLVLIDVPSAGKTITINFFSEIEELVYMTDKFTPASFVSNATNVKKNELDKIDLLPKIRYKLFGVRDLAPIFGQRDDDLLENIAILTRVLDGEGFQTDTGAHGGRGYKGDYMFLMIAGSTPMQPRVWRVMGNLGGRLYFYTMKSRDKSEDELANQLSDEAYKIKEKNCRNTTRDLLYTLWNKHQEGVSWNKKEDSIENKKIISRCARLLARLRGVINVWKDKSEDGKELSYRSPIIEKPDRINQHLYNLARGHALICGRSQINKEDLRFVIELAFDSAPSSRATIFRKLIDSAGTLTTGQVEVTLRCSNPTALEEMEKLRILGVVSETEKGFGVKEIKLASDLDWFLSEECKGIRGLPLPPKQRTMSDLVNEYDSLSESDTVGNCSNEPASNTAFQKWREDKHTDNLKPDW